MSKRIKILQPILFIFAHQIIIRLKLISIYPNSFEQKVGFDKVRELTRAKCLCALGAQKVDEVSFCTSFVEVQLLLDQVDEMKHICMFEQAFPTDNYYDLLAPLQRIEAEGLWMNEMEILNLRRSLETIRAIITFLSRVVDRYPTIHALTKDVIFFPFVIERIDAILDKFGKVKDNASPELAQIRRNIASKQSSVTRLVQGILRRAVCEGLVDSDVQPSVREGRVVIPIAAANKRRLNGIVQDESATGRTVFIEPMEVVETNNEIRELEYEERREVMRILVEFSDTIRPYLPDLIGSYNFLGIVDFIRAKALFAIDYFGAKPILKETAGSYLRQAKHPILLKNLKKEGKSIVPLDIVLDSQGRIVLISGPNAGGKSVCLKTVGLLQYMMQCGFLPCVLENSEMGMYSGIFIDIGDEQSIENDLSTYSSHLVNMKHFLRSANSSSLVLIDEFGSGTEPTAGGAIAEAILRQFCSIGVYGVITTHYSNLKHFAANTQGVVNGAMLFDNAKIEPLFKLEIGKPGSSFAFEIARKIGLPEQVLSEATSLVGDDYVTFEKHLREISRDKRYWEKKRDNIRLASKRSDEMQDKLEQELNTVKEQRKEILANAKREAKELLSQTNKQIENTIRAIKEANAQKEPTKQVREELDRYKSDVEHFDADDGIINRKIEQIKRRQERKIQKMGKPDEEKPNASKNVEEEAITVGDKVQVDGQEVVGEVLSISSQSASIAFGNMITVVQLKRLKRLSSGDFRRANKTVDRPQTGLGFDTFHRKLNFKSDIDIRGYRADEAISAIQELVDDALMFSIGRVRILHGKGNGILRQVVRDYLKNAPGVKRYADEHVERGGAGITVVELE